jgi:hypothetical protein
VPQQEDIFNRFFLNPFLDKRDHRHIFFFSALSAEKKTYFTFANSVSLAKRAVKNMLAPIHIAGLGPSRLGGKG